VGGSCFNDAVPSTFRYSDVCQKLNSKFSDTVSFKVCVCVCVRVCACVHVCACVRACVSAFAFVHICTHSA